MTPLEGSGDGITGQPLAAISISLWSSGVELRLGTLSSPFVIKMTVEGHGHGLGAFICNVWNESASAWLVDSWPVSIAEICSNDTDCASVVTCHAHHLTSFALVANEFSSAENLFDLQVWAKNPFGLVVVMTLLLVSIGLITYSFCWHVRGLRDGRAVVPDEVNTTAYAKQLLVAG